MSSHHQNQPDQVAHFAGLILVLTFIIIFFILSANSQGLSSSPTPPAAEESSVVAQVDPTDTAQPTDTPLPPTSTPTTVPTNTPAPTNTLVPTSTVVPTNTPLPPTDTPQAAADETERTGAADYDPAVIARGEQLFMQCAACHGMDAQGVPNLGKDLVGTEFMRTHSDEEVMQLVITGRPIWDPENTTGIDMPSRGGNPALTNDDILAIIAYLRSLDTGED